MSKAIKIIFPFGMFFVLFIVFSAISSGITGYLYYNQLKKDINKSVNDAKKISSSITNASADIAELSDGKTQKERLSKVFTENIIKDYCVKAFYVLEDGEIVAHSNPAEITRLGGNIALDEFQYNTDQIFLCLKQKRDDIYFSDYYLIEEKIPFTKQEIKYIKEYLYSDVDKNGWLSSKAVEKRIKISKNKFQTKKVGTINYIISKKSLYNNLIQTRDNIIQTAIILLAICAGISLFISIIVYIRYVMISRKTSQNINYDAVPEYQSPENIDIDIDSKNKYDTFSEYPENDIKADDYFTDTTFSEVSPNLRAVENTSEPHIQIVYDEEDDDDNSDAQIIIQDAIPVKRKRTG